MSDALFGYPQLLAYVRDHKLAVLSSLGPAGEPQSALVGIAVTDTLQIIFDTVSTSRKHGNLVRDPRAAVTFSGPGEKTAQFEGLASSVSLDGDEDNPIREVYYAAWPDGRERRSWTNLAYWRIDPVWARYTDYDAGPLVREFRWPKA